MVTLQHYIWLALTLSLCYALDKPKLFQSQIELDQAALIQNVGDLQKTIDFYDVKVPDNGCPVCEDVNNEETDRFIKNTLTRASGLLRRSSTFTRFKRFTRTKLGRRQYNAKVSVETIVLMLKVPGSQFSALSAIGSEVKLGISDDHELKASLVDLLEGVATSSATFLTNVTNMLERSNTTTAGVATISILSILEFYERVTLSTTSVVVAYLNVLAGVSVVGFPEKVHNLLSTTSVLAPINDFLRVKRDQSGLTAVLVEASTSIADIGRRLDRFMEMADAAIVSSGDTSLQSESTYGTETLIAGIMAAGVTSVNHMALGSVDVVGAMLGSVLGLLVARIDGILTLFVSTLQSVVGLSVAIADKRDTSVSGDVLVFILCEAWVTAINDGPAEGGYEPTVFCFLLGLLPLVVLISPIWAPILMLYYIVNIFNIGRKVLFLPDDESFTQPFRCQLDALTCQNNALSATLSLL